MKNGMLVRWVGAVIVGVIGVGAAWGQGAGGQPDPAGSGLPVVTKLLVIEPCMRSLRSPLFIDPIEHALATGAFKPPVDGEVVRAPEATSADIGASGEPKAAVERTWHWLEAKKEPPAPDTPPSDPSDPGTRPIKPAGPARFEDAALTGGYAFVTVTSPVRRVAMLDAAGHRHVYVSSHGADGSLTWTPRVGDVYENGLVRVPIVLEAGETHLLFRAGRGGLSVGFAEAPARFRIEARDATLPTMLRDDPEIKTYLAGIQVTNLTESPQMNLGVRTTLEGANGGWTGIVSLPPLSVTKVPVEFFARTFGEPPQDKVKLKVELLVASETVHEQTFTLDVRSKRDKHTRTFKSAIDGSVQYFAVVPASGAPAQGQKPALILSLHGASVEATNQAGAYAPKDWAWIVCPTNRRPFGFDWEDWGRLDAMEVLAEARRLFDPDPRKLYLTGHSMGGHGTWQLGVTYPGVFAAIAPSAGWPDFWAYTGAGEWTGDDPVRTAMRRAIAPSRTLELVDRLKDTPIYILHGDKDDNVPIEMARTMVGKLAKHEDLKYHEQPGAGHWWGNECVDWPALMDFLKAHTLKEDPVIPDLPISGGGFKDAFRGEVVLVYGTKGTPQENAWSLAKARFDSETFLYRGNASLTVMSDDDYLKDAKSRRRDAVCYGNDRSNIAWATLADTKALMDKIGQSTPGQGVLAVVARRGDEAAGRRIGLVGGADITGMRLTNQLPYFVSGVGYPEWFVIGGDALLTGIRGVRSAGWFSDAR